MAKYRFSAYLFALLCLTCCEERPPSNRVGHADVRTSNPSRLYFNNLRQTDYIRSDSTRGMDRYQFRAFPDSSNQPVFMPIILDNWIEDEAYLQFEALPYPGTYAQPLQFIVNSRDTIRLASSNALDQLTFGRQLLVALRSNQPLMVVTATGGTKPLYQKGYGSDWTRTVLDDYFKLVDDQ